MRLTCPNCRAQYEVDDRAIPEEGRDVQCSNCGQTWFQERIEAGPLTPDHLVSAEAAAGAPTPKPETKVEDTTPPRNPVENSILQILREEAEREQKARAQDRSAELVEQQQDLGLQAATADEAARPVSPQTADVKKSLPELAPDEPADTASDTGAELLRKSELPDLEKIDTAMDEIADAENQDSAKDPRTFPEEPSGFSRGFALVIVSFGVALVCYTFAQTIVQYVPQAEPALTKYVQFVDQVRISTDNVIVGLVNKIESM